MHKKIYKFQIAVLIFVFALTLIPNCSHKIALNLKNVELGKNTILVRINYAGVGYSLIDSKDKKTDLGEIHCIAGTNCKPLPACKDISNMVILCEYTNKIKDQIGYDLYNIINWQDIYPIHREFIGDFIFPPFYRTQLEEILHMGVY